MRRSAQKKLNKRRVRSALAGQLPWEPPSYTDPPICAVSDDEIVAIGTKVFLKATAKINDTICYGYAETSEHKGMSAEQATGTASSYARKYALNGLFLIDETESDADSQKQPEPKNESKPMLTPETLKKMITAIQEGKSDKVKEAMDNYTISGPQSNVLKLALINV